MPITGTVPITAPIAPTSEIATYPVTNPAYGLGGLRTVGTTADRNAISTPRRQVGMIVYVSSLNKYYHLVGGTADTDWQEFSLGAGVVGPTGPTGNPGVTGPTGLMPTNYVESLNSLTGPLQISAGDNITLTVSGKTLIITSSDTFDADITASIPQPKTFGKYSYGDRVPAAGRTAVQVITEALLDTIPPGATFTTNPTSIQFNQTQINTAFNLSHTILTIGATSASGVLQTRRNSDGSWVTLRSDLFTPNGTSFSGTYTHTLTDAPYGASGTFNYRYIVTDSRGASTTVTRDVPIVGYQTTTGTLSVAAFTSRGGVVESNLVRERGNTRSVISGSATLVNPNVPLSGWFTQFRARRTSQSFDPWTTYNSGAFGSQPYTIPTHTHIAPTGGNIEEIQYRLQVTDGFDTDGVIVTLGGPSNTTVSVSLHNLIWYGPTASPPTTSNHVRNGLSVFNPVLFTQNPFTFESGITHTNFVVALPSPSRITNVVDLRSLQVDLTDQFLTANSAIGWTGMAAVNDFAGNAALYNVYNYNSGNPYLPKPGEDGALFRVTRA